MKRLLLFVIFAYQSVSSQCYNPCDEWYSCGLLRGNCRPGFYVGGHVGHSWIQTPKLGKIKIKVEDEALCSNLKGQRGDFSWGVFVGYSSCFWFPGLYAGFEVGYHNNGSSAFFVTESIPITSNYSFPDTFKSCKICSHDWDVSATFDYAFLCCFDLFVKIGGAEVCERFTTQNSFFDEKRSKKATLKEWAPVVNAGIGYCLYDFLRATLSYRGVYCKSHREFKKNIKIDEGCSTLPAIIPSHCSSVQSVYGGLVFTF